jgi:hypothetical protein
MGPSPFSERSLGGWAATPLLSVAAPLNACFTRIVTFSCLLIGAIVIIVLVYVLLTLL